MKRVAVALLAIALAVPTIAGGIHARPKAASPVHGALVPAYEPCTAADRTHGPPLAYGSCSGPQQASDYLTVGTPDANGSPAKSVGSFRVEARAGIPGPPTDNRISFFVRITDVHCQGVSAGCPGPGEDYSGTVEARIPIQATDHFNGTDPGGGAEPGTVQLVNFTFPVSCTATADPTIGSTCARSIGYIEELGPAINDGRRTLWEFGPLQLWDGGADGDGETGADNTLFAVQGLFVP
ncbi:MAG: hypothetical protein ACRDLQ_04590 [Solirubrobacterales bacterium]